MPLWDGCSTPIVKHANSSPHVNIRRKRGKYRKWPPVQMAVLTDELENRFQRLFASVVVDKESWVRSMCVFSIS